MESSRNSFANQPTADPAQTNSASSMSRVQITALGMGVTLLSAGLAVLAIHSFQQATLLLIGACFGITLYHAAFGFTSAYRRMLLYRDMAGVRAQILMLSIATLVFAPVLASGSVFGRGVIGAVAPAGWQVVFGAFMFGLGMQLGGGCGSGTLYALGGGSLRSLFTLASFIAGSFWASLHMGSWRALPSLGLVVLGDELGWAAAMVLQLGLLLLLWIVVGRWGGGRVRDKESSVGGWHAVLCGPWSLFVGAISLAGLNVLTLLIAGHPWTITWAFTLWGAKLATFLGWDPASSPFWSAGFQSHALMAGIFDDTVSVMDIGIVLGALCGGSLAGRFAPRFEISPRSLVAALIGGLAMGYGARIAFGCNIGAFFSGVASTSLHGWIWIAAALPGTWFGVKLRPYFGLTN